MRPSQLWQITLCVASLAIPLVSNAQATAPVSSAPPKLEQLDEDIPPALKKQNPNLKPSAKPEVKPTITEKREQGRVTEVKVKSGKSTYYLKPNNQFGNTVHGELQSNDVRGAQWSVKEFDLGQKKKPKPKDDASNSEAPPPPPPSK
jgi:hypothetical protein